MSPNNELDRERLMKAIENSTILPHHRAAGQGKWGGPTTELIQLTNDAKPAAFATAISAVPNAESETSATRVAVPRPTPQNTGSAPR
jgi:hypothetical protein